MSFNVFDKLDKIYKHVPLVIAHRGASYDAPENTLAAFSLARKLGADGVELDTSLTRDGVPIVMHDLNLDTTTDASGPIRALDLKAIKALDAGSHFDVSFKAEQIPTLSEVFETLGPEMIINIELKSNSWRSDGLEAAVLAVIRQHNASSRVIISSFNSLTLRRLRAIAPDLPIGFLYSPDSPVYMRWLMVGLPHEAKHPQQSMVDAAYMSWARTHGYRVHTWTVDDPMRIRVLSDLGVDAIITNRPDIALEVLGRVSTHRSIS